jgi:DNA polymerase-3 subunit epsilon
MEEMQKDCREQSLPYASRHLHASVQRPLPTETKALNSNKVSDSLDSGAAPPRTRPHAVAVGAVAGLACGTLSLNAWLVIGTEIGLRVLALVFVLEALAVAAGAALAWAWLEQRVFRPLRMLADDVRLITHGNPAHRIELPDGHQLGRLSESVDTLALEFARARSETIKVIETAGARVARRNARLEAILGDLTEGVVVCTLQHRIVLFNQVAADMLGNSASLGLNRPLTALIQPAPLRDGLSQLWHGDDTPNSAEVLPFECRPVDDTRAPFEARMRLVLQPDGACSGYVVSLSGYTSDAGGDSATGASGVNRLERPVFYDFDLFDRDFDTPDHDIPLASLDFVVFDSETTGLQPSSGDEIVQVAAVRVVNGRILHSEIFDRLANPGRLIPGIATRIHGITDVMVSDQPPVAEVLKSFHRFAKDEVLVAHNAAFDLKFFALKEQDTGVSFDQPVLDTLLLSVVIQPDQTAHTLDAIAHRFGISIEGRHTALGDAVATAQVLIRMIEILASRGIVTLGDAVEASNRQLDVRRLQANF